MRQQEQQTHDVHPEAVRSEPVPVPPPTGDELDERTDALPDPAVDQEATADRSRYDDDSPRDVDSPDGFAPEGIAPDEDAPDASTTDDAAEREDRPDFHPPAPVPSAFGASTVGGAVAASALAGNGRAAPDPRADQTTGPGDGAVEDGVTRTPDGWVPADAAPDGPVPDSSVPVDSVAALVSPETAQDFRDRWRDVQLRFVDDPHGAAVDARQVAEDVVESLTAALAERRDALHDWQDGDGGDTEHLRVTVRRYRELVDRLLSL